METILQGLILIFYVLGLIWFFVENVKDALLSIKNAWEESCYHFVAFFILLFALKILFWFIFVSIEMAEEYNRQ